MNDKAIRAALREWISESDPHAILIDEMPLCRGVGRADLAAVNGALNGFEIKSDCDTLSRLPKQIETYHAVFDYCHLVVGARYLDKSKTVAPANWGIIVVETRDARPVVRRVRKAKRNRSIDTFSLIRLLWKTEVIRVLRQMGSAVSAQTPVRALWNQLASVTQRVIAEHVRDSLKARATAAVVPPSSQCDDSRPIAATVAALQGH